MVDLLNYEAGAPTKLVIKDGCVCIVALAALEGPDEVCWDYESVHGSPLVLLTQYARAASPSRGTAAYARIFF